MVKATQEQLLHNIAQAQRSCILECTEFESKALVVYVQSFCFNCISCPFSSILGVLGHGELVQHHCALIGCHCCLPQLLPLLLVSVAATRVRAALAQTLVCCCVSCPSVKLFCCASHLCMPALYVIHQGQVSTKHAAD